MRVSVVEVVVVRHEGISSGGGSSGIRWQAVKVNSRLVLDNKRLNRVVIL